MYNYTIDLKLLGINEGGIMHNLRKMLLEEQKHLETIISKASESLKIGTGRTPSNIKR